MKHAYDGVDGVAMIDIDFAFHNHGPSRVGVQSVFLMETRSRGVKEEEDRLALHHAGCSMPFVIQAIDRGGL